VSFLRATTGILERRWPSTLATELDRFYTPVRDSARLLDFGCGSATFLRQAAERGWQAEGADMSPAVVETVRAAGFEAHIVGDRLWTHTDHEPFDAIRLNHVLEHLYDPAETLARLHGALRHGGGLHVAVPNPVSVGACLFRTRWVSLDAPRHVMLFPQRLLVRLFLEAGFHSVRVVQEVLTKDLSRSLGLLLLDRGRLSRSEALTLDQHPLLATFLQPVAIAAARFGIADRLHVFAVS